MSADKQEGGKYGDEADFVLRATGARAIVLVVLKGILGSGFELAFSPETEDDVKVIVKELPRALRGLADAIEKSPPNVTRKGVSTKPRK